MKVLFKQKYCSYVEMQKCISGGCATSILIKSKNLALDFAHLITAI
jgi:hypothetical protein